MAENDALPSLSFPPATFKKLHPQEYLRRFTTSEVRADGRSLRTFRPATANAGSLSNAFGSAVVRMGNTTVVCGIKGEIAEPDVERPREGWLVPNIELTPICSTKFKYGPPGDLAQSLGEKLDTLVKATKALPLDTLCIEEGKAAWVLYADVICLNYDGNVFDAAWMALMTALEDTKLPVAKWDEDREHAVCSDTETRRLDVAGKCYASTFGLFDGQYLLADMDDDEEELVQESVTIVVNNQGRLCNISKGGGMSLSVETLRECVAMAKRRYAELNDVTQKAKGL
ncbi:hypothetical protein YB2330_005336 [Saitoella coloradoensis]